MANRFKKGDLVETVGQVRSLNQYQIYQISHIVDRKSNILALKGYSGMYHPSCFILSDIADTVVYQELTKQVEL